MPSAYIHYLIPWAEWSPHNYVFIDVTTCSDYIRASTDAPIGHAELAHPVQGTSTSHAPACLQNPTLTDSFLSQRTPGRTATKSRLLEIPAYKKLLLPEVVTHCCHHHWYLKPSVLYMAGGGKAKKKRLNKFFPLFLFLPFAVTAWAHCMHYQPVSQKLVQGFHTATLARKPS